MRWRIDLEYDGTGFAGWQLQPGVRTIQGALEEALEGLLGHPVRVHGAGRTDTGVHAEQQVAIFDTGVVRPPEAIRGGLNATLPDDVACVEATVAAADFDPRRWPHTKRYRYRWLERPSRSPLRHHRVWHVRRALDHAAMADAVAALRGTHDFSAFRAVGCSAAHAVRTMEGARVERAGDEVHLVMEGTGFLRHMIRIVAGSLHEVGCGRRRPEWLTEVLVGKDRAAAGRTAPAMGLTLESVRYHADTAPSPGA